MRTDRSGRAYASVSAWEIRQHPCPVCGASVGQFCDRVELRDGKTPSHTERMWIAQGHEPADFDDLWAGMRAGKTLRNQS